MPLDPQSEAFLNDLASLNAPTWDQMPPEEGRKLFASLTDLFGPAEPVHDVADRQLGDVGLRVYTPAETPPFPVVVYFHGGGWVLGDRDTHDALCRRLTNGSGCVVISVDYRRSPECKFPGPLDDCFAAVRHVAEHPHEYQADSRRIAVAGDSAGGNLATAVALKARDQGGPAIKLQLLIYPITNHDFDTPSYLEFADGYGLTRDAMRWFWKQYLANAEDGEHPYASPLRADVSKLPSAHFILAEYDVLRDDGAAYAQRLKEAGVPTAVRRYHGMIHGFVHFAGVLDAGKQATDDAALVLREALRPGQPA